jgi:hypothetical protein
MQLWKRTLSIQGLPVLEPVSTEEISGEMPIVFVFPGKRNIGCKDSITESSKQELSGFIKLVEQLSGGDSLAKKAAIYIVSYDDHEQNFENLLKSNQLLDKFTEPEAEKFAKEFLIPLINKGLQNKITIFTQSYGAAFAQNVRVATINALREQNCKDEIIAKNLEDIVLVSSGNPSTAAVSNVDNRNGNLDYTSIFFTSPKDILAKEINPHFEKTIPEDHQNLSITKLSGNNRIQVTVNTPSVVIYNKDSKRDTVALAEDPNRHLIRMYAQRGGESSVGGVAALERSLRNAILREGPTDAIELLSKKQCFHDKNDHSPISNINILEQYAITAAIDKMPKKVITTDSTPKPMENEGEKTLT